MNTHPTQTEAETEADQPAQDAQYYRRILHRMIDRGDVMADMVVQRAQAQAEAEAAPYAEPSRTPAPDFTIQFDRVARTVRRCIVLARKVAEPVTASVAVDRVAMRKKVIRRVEDAIHQEAGAHEADTLRAELVERLDAPEFEDDLNRPIEEVIREIQADLGVMGAHSQTFWMRRRPQDVAELNARAAAPYQAKAAPDQAAVGPYNLPMPPPGWVDPEICLGHSEEGAPRFRGGP